jgi:hypothetical protein
MNNVAMYREEYQTAINEIIKAGGKVQKIYHNIIYFNLNKTDYVFAAEMTEGGRPMFFKKPAKEFQNN